MTVQQLLLTQFRHIERSHIFFDARENLIVGQNGSGKTSILEAIYYLAYAKSFRSQNNRSLIGHSYDRFQIDAKICLGETHHSVQSIYGNDKSVQHLTLDQDKRTKQSVLARMLPVVFIDASTHREFAGTPKNRRDFLNWCCFYTVPEYHQNLMRFQRALQQRNQLLKQCKVLDSNMNTLLATWTEPLIYYAEKIHEARLALVAQLNQQLTDTWHCFLNSKPGTVVYEPGWRQTMTYASCLAQSLSQDLHYGFTQHGPHRGDLSCLSETGHSIFQSFSQGQQKLFSYMIKCAQLKLLPSPDADKSVLLIDDLAAELDDENQSKVLQYLKDMACQKFLTALDPAVFSGNFSSNAMYVDGIADPADTYNPKRIMAEPV